MLTCGSGVVVWEIMRKDNMKATIKKINKQHSVLVDVIQYLDSTKQSNTKIREAVDEILNHSDELHENSNIELERYQIENK